MGTPAWDPGHVHGAGPGRWRGAGPGPWPGSGPGPWLALLVGVPQLLGTWVAAQGQPDRQPLDAVATALLVLSALSLVARIRAPVVTLVVAAAATAAYYGLGYPYGPAFLALFVATVGAVFRGHRRATWMVLAVAFGGFLLLDRITSGQWLSPAAVLVHVAVLGGLVVVAELVRARAERFAEIRRSMQESRRRQASEERLQLARELHDVLAHNVSLINVQASTALHLFEAEPERARSALAAIKEASRESLQELRATVGSLRAEGETAPRAPTAGLDRLDDLAAQTSAIGPAVDVHRRGDVRPLPPRVDLAAYRIVQEALTNARRHSGASTVEVVLRYGAGALDVEVSDDGRGAADASAVDEGHGIRGMRERAYALGGTLTVGSPSGASGFRVAARLPLVAREEST